MSAAGRHQTSMLTVYDGQRCVGFVLNRGKAGYEAINDNDRSIGAFATQRDAVNELLGGVQHE